VNPPAPRFQPVSWRAVPLPAQKESPALSLAAIDASWVALTQSFRSPTAEQSFQPGWARIFWDHSHFHYETVFQGRPRGNRAVRLNERTWELGDVCEIFLLNPESGGYLELHVTPENQRLQLFFPSDGIQRVRAKSATLEAFMIAQPDWVRTKICLGPDFWAVHAVVPCDRMGLGSLAPGQQFRTAVCRYDYLREEPILSSTIPHRAASFHEPNTWHPLTVVDGD